MKTYTKTEIAILDFLYSANLPSIITAPDVEWVYHTFHGLSIGITNEQAQTIEIISERCGEIYRGGVLEYVRGRNFAGTDHLLV